jgi:hypothetical protein
MIYALPLNISSCICIEKKDYVVTNVLSSAAAKRRLNLLEAETPTILRRKANRGHSDK